MYGKTGNTPLPWKHPTEPERSSFTRSDAPSLVKDHHPHGLPCITIFFWDAFKRCLFLLQKGGASRPKGRPIPHLSRSAGCFLPHRVLAQRAGATVFPMKKAMSLSGRNGAAFAAFGMLLMVLIRWNQLVGLEDTFAWAEISGWGLLAVGLYLAGDMESRFRGMMERLFRREMVCGLVESPALFLSSMEDFARKLGRVGSIAFPIVLWLTYLTVARPVASSTGEAGTLGEFFAIKLALETMGAFLVGRHAGQMVGYGLVGHRFERQRVRLRVIPAYPDGAGGLRMVGDFFFFQAGLVMLPLGFFAFWLAMPAALTGSPHHEILGVSSSVRTVSTSGSITFTAPVNSADDAGISDKGTSALLNWFHRWRRYFALFLLVMLAIEVVAFVVPMGFFHREMSRNADEAAAEADIVGREISALELAIAKVSTNSERQEMEGKRAHLITVYETLEALPRWPVDAGIRRRFTLGNGIILVVPLLAKIPLIESAIGGIFK